MDNHEKTPKEVAQAVQDDLAERSLSVANAARRMGLQPYSLYNSLRGEYRIGAKMASCLNKCFGYSIDFLKFGVGNLYNEINTDDELYKQGWIVYFEDDDKLSERERLLNTICKIFSKHYFQLLEEIPIKFSFNLNLNTYPSLKDLGFIPQTEIEERLATTIEQFAAQLHQVTDAKSILNHSFFKASEK